MAFLGANQLESSDVKISRTELSAGPMAGSKGNRLVEIARSTRLWETVELEVR